MHAETKIVYNESDADALGCSSTSVVHEVQVHREINHFQHTAHLNIPPPARRQFSLTGRTGYKLGSGSAAATYEDSWTDCTLLSLEINSTNQQLTLSAPMHT